MNFLTISDFNFSIEIKSLTLLFYFQVKARPGVVRLMDEARAAVIRSLISRFC